MSLCTFPTALGSLTLPTPPSIPSGWLTAHAYVVGNRVTNPDGGGVIHLYECTVAGTSGAPPGPVVATGTTTDGTVTWKVVVLPALPAIPPLPIPLVPVCAIDEVF